MISVVGSVDFGEQTCVIIITDELESSISELNHLFFMFC